MKRKFELDVYTYIVYIVYIYIIRTHVKTEMSFMSFTRRKHGVGRLPTPTCLCWHPRDLWVPKNGIAKGINQNQFATELSSKYAPGSFLQSIPSAYDTSFFFQMFSGLQMASIATRSKDAKGETRISSKPWDESKVRYSSAITTENFQKLLGKLENIQKSWYQLDVFSEKKNPLTDFSSQKNPAPDSEMRRSRPP